MPERNAQVFAQIRINTKEILSPRFETKSGITIKSPRRIINVAKIRAEYAV
jgi:hypothetical protein